MSNYMPSPIIRQEITNFSTTVPNGSWIGYERNGTKRILLTSAVIDNRQMKMGKSIATYPRSELLGALASIQNSLPHNDALHACINNILLSENNGKVLKRSYIGDVIWAGLISLGRTF